jgi:hypothetical protein
MSGLPDDWWVQAEGVSVVVGLPRNTLDGGAELNDRTVTRRTRRDLPADCRRHRAAGRGVMLCRTPLHVCHGRADRFEPSKQHRDSTTDSSNQSKSNAFRPAALNNV